MFELIVVGALALCAIVVIGTLMAAASLLGWLIWLPLRILGFAIRGVGLLLALPFILVGGVLAAIALGIGAVFVFVPLAPLALLVLGIAWWVRHSHRRRAATS